MAEIFVFTIFASVVAFYSVLPRHRKMRVQFALPDWLKYLIGIGGLIVIALYLIGQYIELAAPSFSWGCGIICLPVPFWIEVFQIGTVIVTSGLVLSVFLRNSVSIHDDRNLETKIRNLFATQQINVLSSLLEDNYDTLLTRGDLDESSSSRDTAKEILTSKSFLAKHDQLNPSLMARIFSDSDSIVDREVILRRYFKSLHTNPMSILYHESERIEGRHGRRVLPESSLILDSLFRDCSIAAELQLWNPIREAVKPYIRKQSDQPDDKYNGRPESFSLDSPGQPSNDPILIGIELFDLFASQALRQKIESHIFFHYLAEIVEEICENFQIGNGAKPNEEFPNAYGYLLKHAIAVYRGVVTLPGGDVDVRMAILNIDTSYEDDLIKNAIWGFVRSTKSILSTNSIPDQFKHDIVNNLILAYIDLAQTNHRAGQAYYATFHKHILYGKGCNLQTVDDEHLSFLDDLRNQINRLDSAQFVLGHKADYRDKLLDDIEVVLNYHL